MHSSLIPTTDPTNFGNKPGDGPLRVGGESVESLTPQSDENLPSTWSQAAKRQQQALELVRDMEEGPERIKEKGQKYLPKDEGEAPIFYNNRLARTYFFNFFGKAVRALTGFVFRRDPVLGDDVPALIREHWENIDLAGTHGDVFLRDLLQDDMVAGHAAILVEFPTTGGKQTAADEKFAIRPYWVPIKKDNIVSWRTRNVNGALVLTQLVLKECTLVPQGLFGEAVQERYRVFHNDEQGVWVEVLEVTKDKKVVRVDGPSFYPTQTEIPVAEVSSSGRKGLFESNPPLLDVAYLNLDHYQTRSDYKWSMHKTCSPTLFGAGVDQSEPNDGSPKPPMVIGPNTVIMSPDPSAKLEYVTHDGASLRSCKEELDALKEDMATLSIAMLSGQKRAAETAEAKRIDKAATDSELGVTARGLQDAAERALYFHARYLKQQSGGSIEINRDFDAMVMEPDVMQAYAALARELGLPVRVVLDQLKAGGRLPQDTDLDALEMEMEAEAEARAERARELAASQNPQNEKPHQPSADGLDKAA